MTSTITLSASKSISNWARSDSSVPKHHAHYRQTAALAPRRRTSNLAVLAINLGISAKGLQATIRGPFASLMTVTVPTYASFYTAFR